MMHGYVFSFCSGSAPVPVSLLLVRLLSTDGRGCKVTESGVETEPMPAALRLCSHGLKLIRWMKSEQQRTCTGVSVS